MNCPLVLLAVIVSPVFGHHLNGSDVCDEDTDLQCHCGTVARPEGTDVFARAPVFGDNSSVPYNHSHNGHNTHESRVWYRCQDRNDLLVGNDVRKCYRGKWLGQVPRCAFNLLNETRLTAIDIINLTTRSKRTKVILTKHFNSLGAFSPPVSKQATNCVIWPTDVQQLWRLRLQPDVMIQYIKMKLLADKLSMYWTNKDFTLHVYLANSRDMSKRINCSHNSQPVGSTSRRSYRNNNSKQNRNQLTLEFSCEEDSHQTHVTYDSVNVELQFLSDSTRFDFVSLCDLRVYQFPQTCGEPDYPLSVQVLDSPVAEPGVRYDVYCMELGYELEVQGKNYVRCGANGQWQDEFPICLPSTYCRGHPNGTFGSNRIVEYEKQYLPGSEWTSGQSLPIFQPGTTARLSCKNGTGDVAHGYEQIICEKGRWRVDKAEGFGGCDHRIDVSDSDPTVKRTVIRVLAMILIVCLLIIFYLIFNSVRCRRPDPTVTLRERHCFPNDYETEFYESEVKYESISETYEKLPTIFLVETGFDELGHQLHFNPIYRDDLSDQGNDAQKTNSIYSNLSNL